MNIDPWILPLPLGVLIGVVLVGAALSLFALWRVRALVREIGRRTGDTPAPSPDTEREFRESLESLAARLAELERQPAAATSGIPVQPRPSLNLSKRSQALRMHRQGQPAGDIARALEIPRQEVELLLKVHRIVLAKV